MGVVATETFQARKTNGMIRTTWRRDEPSLKQSKIRKSRINNGNGHIGSEMKHRLMILTYNESISILEILLLQEGLSRPCLPVLRFNVEFIAKEAANE